MAINMINARRLTRERKSIAEKLCGVEGFACWQGGEEGYALRGTSEEALKDHIELKHHANLVQINGWWWVVPK